MAGFGVVASRLYALVSRNSRSTSAVVEFCALGVDDRVLEVGCGAGSGVQAAAEQIGAERVAAVDPSPTFVGQVRRRVPDADVRVAGAEDVPFADGSFTVIFTVASMHHWDDRSAGLSTLVAKLAPGGRLVIAERAISRKGHGITPAGTAEVTAELTALGQIAVESVERRVGHRTITIISSTRPD